MIFCQVWITFGEVVLEKTCLNFLNVLSLFLYYLPLEKGSVLYLKKLESPLPNARKICANFLLKLAQWLWRRRFLNVNSYFLFYYYVPLVKGLAFHLNKLEFPLSKDALCQVWLKMAIWFRTRFSNFVNVFSLFRYYFPLERNMILHIH